MECISFFWKFLSLPNVIEDRDKTLIDTFNYASFNSPCSDHAHVKSILNLSIVDKFDWIGPHAPAINGIQKIKTLNGRVLEEEHAKITGLDFYDDQKVILYHFFHQSWEDRLFKLYRGGRSKNGTLYYPESREEFEKEIVGKYKYLDNNLVERKRELGI